MKRAPLVVLVGLALAACGTDQPKGPEILPGIDVPKAPAPDKGWQIVTPIVENIQPGADEEICTWTDVIADKQTDIRSTFGVQDLPPGHHIIIFYTMVRQPPNTQRICNDSDMATFRFVAGSAGEGIPNQAPGNLVFRVPPGAQIVVNHHYLNSSDQVMRGQAVVNLNFADPNGSYVPSGYLTVLNTGLEVQPGDTTQTMHAVLDRSFKLWQLFPHMHQWGKHAILKVTHAGTTSTLFDIPWDPSYAFHPPTATYDPSMPLQLDPGDSIDMSCEWNNDQGHSLGFGFEMCVVFASTVDDNNDANWDWDNGNWGTF